MFGFPRDSTLSEFRSFVLSNHSTSDFESTFAVNTSAVFFATVAFLELLDAGNKKGNLTQKSQVIITSSIGGLHRLAFAGYAYGASKAATNHLMKMMATNWAGWGIRANVVAPGSEFSSISSHSHVTVIISPCLPLPSPRSLP